jgi:Phage integrase, N-terminal SAM-like domain
LASITNRAKNKWFVRVYLGRVRGELKYHNKLIRGDKKAAQTYASKIEAARDGGTLEELLNPKPTKTLTLGAYLDRWLAEAVKPSVRETTYDGYSGILKRYVRPPLGSVALAKITPPDIQGLYNSMRGRGLSTRMIQYTHAVCAPRSSRPSGGSSSP